MEDVIHVNATDPNGQVYCHYQGDVVNFDGVHVSKVCWTCPFWTGLNGGFGVECTYDDPGATANPMKYTKAGAAKAEAPEPTDDPNSVSSQGGLASMQARQGLQNEEPVEETEEQAPEEAPTNEKPAPKEQSAVPAQQKEQAPEDTQQQVPAKKKVPPQFQKATAADVIAEVLKTQFSNK